MKKIGVVVEYNPFHNGHLYQINEIKKKFGNDILLVIVISGDFVQRGEISYLDKWEKTKIALNYGIDLVIELPLYYSIQNAEVFSKMSVKILDYMEMDIQVFGAENEEIEKLYEIVALQEKKEYKESFFSKMKNGNSYSNSQRLVLEEYGCKEIVKSNNILGIEYIRTIKNEKLKIEPCIIKREVSEYIENEIGENREKIASASFLRNKLNFEENSEKNKEKVLTNIKRFLPKEVYEIIYNKEIINNKKKSNLKSIKDRLYEIIKYKILTNSKKKIMEIYDMTEEIYVRIHVGLLNSKNHKQFLERVKSRNFSIKRIERLMLNVLLDIEKKSVDYNIDYVRILGFNEKGQKYLKELKLKDKKNIFVNWKDIEKQIESKKLKIEKNGFLIKQMFFEENEKLNPIIMNKQEG